MDDDKLDKALEALIEIANKFGYESSKFKDAFKKYVQEYGNPRVRENPPPEGAQTNGKRTGFPEWRLAGDSTTDAPEPPDPADDV